jgi:spore germination protein KC
MIIAGALILTSCYDSTDVDDMAYIIAIGIDETNQKEKTYTFQAVLPLNINGGVTSDAAESTGDVSVQNIIVNAENIFSAFDSANTKLSKELNVSHCKLVLFSENTSNKTLKNNIETINSYNKFRPDILIAFCKNNAGEHLGQISSSFEKNPARYYENFFHKNFSNLALSTKVAEFQKHKTLVAPVYDRNSQISTIIIDDYNNVMSLSADESTILGMLYGTFNNSYIAIDENSAISVHKTSPAKIDVNIKNTTPHFKITLNIHGKIFAKDKGFIKEKFCDLTEKQCLDLLNKVTKQNADILHLINRSKPHFITVQKYNEYNWKSKFPESTFDIKVNFHDIN